MSKRQKGKKMKRRKAWHAHNGQDMIVEPINPAIDYTQAVPQPFKRKHPPKRTDVV